MTNSCPLKPVEKEKPTYHVGYDVNDIGWYVYENNGLTAKKVSDPCSTKAEAEAYLTTITANNH